MPKNFSYLLYAGPYLVLLCLGFFLWGSSGDDDAYITYWSVKQFVDFGFIGNVNGELVEQSSSLLHVLLLAGAYKISGINLINLGAYFSLLMALLCLPLVSKLAQLLKLDNAHYATWFLAFSAAFSCWAMGGLESTLIAFLILSFATACFFFISAANWQNTLLTLALALLYLLARPEAYFVLISAFLALLFFSYSSEQIPTATKKILGLCLVLSVAFLLIGVLRLQIYGQFFPQPVYAKAGGFSLQKLTFGLLYFLFSMQLSIIIYTLLLLVPISQLLKKKQLELLPAILLSLSLALLAFTVVSGGDWMPAGRFFVPVVPLLILLFLHTVQGFHYKKQTLFTLLVVALLEVSIIPYIFSTGIRVQSFSHFEKSLEQPIAMQDKPWAEKMNIVHIHDFLLSDHLLPVVEAVKQHKQPVELLSVQMGLEPYYVRDTFGEAVHFTDMRGLTTTHLTDCKALKEIKQNWLGIFITYNQYFAELDKEQCDLPTPDIIYDHERDHQLIEFLKTRDYVIIYQQKGTIKTAYASRYVPGNAFIAIKKALFDDLPEPLKQRYYRFEYK